MPPLSIEMARCSNSNILRPKMPELAWLGPAYAYGYGCVIVKKC